MDGCNITNRYISPRTSAVAVKNVIAVAALYMNKRDFEIITDFYAMRERRPLFGYGLQRSGMSAVYHSVYDRADFLIRFDTLWHSCDISTRQWKGYNVLLCDAQNGKVNWVSRLKNLLEKVLGIENDKLFFENFHQSKTAFELQKMSRGKDIHYKHFVASKYPEIVIK